MKNKIISIILSVLLVVVICMSFATTYNQNRTGTVSAATCNISAENKEYILNRYGDCKTAEELIIRLNNEICTEYTYHRPFIIFQSFDFDNFVKEKKGLCFDYSCYLKIVFNTIFPEMKVFVCDVRVNLLNYHSYNFIETGSKRYFVDLTTDLMRYKNGQKRIIYENIGNLSYDEYTKQYNEKILNFH